MINIVQKIGFIILIIIKNGKCESHPRINPGNCPFIQLFRGLYSAHGISFDPTRGKISYFIFYKRKEDSGVGVLFQRLLNTVK